MIIFYLTQRSETEIERAEGNVSSISLLTFFTLSVVEFYSRYTSQHMACWRWSSVCVCFQGVSLCQTLCFHSHEERDDESQAGLSMPELRPDCLHTNTTFGFDSYVMSFLFFHSAFQCTRSNTLSGNDYRSSNPASRNRNRAHWRKHLVCFTVRWCSG